MIVLNTWTKMLEIVQHGVTGILGERQPGLKATLAGDAESTLRPVDVRQTQISNIAGAQTQPTRRRITARSRATAAIVGSQVATNCSIAWAEM